jgi:hypothetical protein
MASWSQYEAGEPSYDATNPEIPGTDADGLRLASYRRTISPRHFVSGVVYRCVVSRTQTVDPHARDSAVVACCLAAGAVSDAALSDRRKAAILMDCLGVLAAISPPGQVMTFGQLRAGLTMPLRELLPATIDLGSTGDVVLLDAEGMLSPEAEDVCHEHFIECAALDQHWSQARVRAEQEEQRLYLALRDLGAESYTRARELLTDNPAGDLRTLRRKWDELWPRFGDYTPISGWRWAQLNGWWFACPSCHWPMRVIEGDHLATVRCDAHDLRGIRYTAQTDNAGGKPPVLQPAGRDAPPVAGQPATSDHLAVSRSVWRYVTLPGVLECQLRDRARGLGAQVEMWPDCDSYDVLIEVGSKEWRVDAKAWASPDRLADAFRVKSTAVRLYIVLPDHQQWACTALDEQLRAQGYRVRTAGQLMDEVSREAGKTR